MDLAEQIERAQRFGFSLERLLARPQDPGGSGVIQARWIRDMDTQTAYWEGRRGPTAQDRADIERQGFTIVAAPPLLTGEGHGTRRGGGGGFGFLPRGNAVSARVTTPGGSMATWGDTAPTSTPDTSMETETIDYGPVSVTHYGVEPQTLRAPMPFTTPPQTSLAGLSLAPETTSSFVTPDVMAEFSGVRDDSSRFPSQHTVMGMSAHDAFVNSGVGAPDSEPQHWLHRHRFTHGGMDHEQPQTQENLVAGTAGSNYRHLAAERSVDHLATGILPVVLTSTMLSEPLAPTHHVYGHMDYTLHSPYDPQHGLTFPINLTTPIHPRHGDQEHVNRAADFWAARETLRSVMGDLPEEEIDSFDPEATKWYREEQERNDGDGDDDGDETMS